MGTYLQKTNSSPSSQRQFTISTWVKVCREGGDKYIWSMRVDDSNWIGFRFATNGCVILQIYDSGSTTGQLQSNRFFRDPSSWYHFVVRVNTNDGTADDRLRIYVNGTQLTSFSNRTNLPSGYDIPITGNFQVATSPYSSQYNSNSLDGYLTDFNYCDNYSYAPTSFAETDSTTGEWKPKIEFTGVSYGNNGFRLKFGNAGALGTDSSGNSNTLTVNNAGTNAQTKDTADNNFATMNPLVIFEGSNSPSNIPTYTEGNTVATADNSTTRFGMGTIATTMPYYFEVKVLSTSSTDTSQRIGVIDDSAYGSAATYSSVYRGDGSITATGESNNTGNQTLSANSIIGIAVDLATNYNIKYYHNGTLQATMAVGSSYRSLATTAFTRLVDSTQSFSFNFGNPSFAISSGNADANGYGNFEYAVPSGYYALCTKNLNTYG